MDENCDNCLFFSLTRRFFNSPSVSNSKLLIFFSLSFMINRPPGILIGFVIWPILIDFISFKISLDN